MRSMCRRVLVRFFAVTAALAFALPAAAQGFGIGARMAFVKADTELDDDSVRFTGGQVRVTGARAGVEVSMDWHTEELEELGQKVKQNPIQISGLLFMAGGAFKPYLLGGPGWYKKTIESIADTDVDVTTREFGWHAGIGAEIRPGRRFGIHGDYRYTFLDFGDDDDDDDDGLIGGLLPSHNGSMWTIGFSFYF